MGLFELGEDGRLYCRGNPLTNRNRELKMVGVIANTLGIKRLQEVGYNVSETNLKPQFVLDLLEKQAELPSMSDITKVDNIQLQEIVKSMEDIIFHINHLVTDG